MFESDDGLGRNAGVASVKFLSLELQVEGYPPNFQPDSFATVEVVIHPVYSCGSLMFQSLIGISLPCKPSVSNISSLIRVSIPDRD